MTHFTEDEYEKVKNFKINRDDTIIEMNNIMFPYTTKLNGNSVSVRTTIPFIVKEILQLEIGQTLQWNIKWVKGTWMPVIFLENLGGEIKQKKERKPLHRDLRHKVFKRDSYKCVECGATKEDIRLHIDHIKPVSKGGTDDIDNLQTLCQDCNLAKMNDDWSEE